MYRTILASVDGEVTTLEKQLQTAKDTERKSLERRDKSAEVGTEVLGTWGLGT